MDFTKTADGTLVAPALLRVEREVKRDDLERGEPASSEIFDAPLEDYRADGIGQELGGRPARRRGRQTKPGLRRRHLERVVMKPPPK